MKYRVLVVVLFSSFLCWGGSYRQAVCVVGVSSVISGGELSPAEIARICRAEGVDVAVFTERDFMRWEYGLPPFRRILRRRVVAPDAAGYGFRRYLREMRSLQDSLRKEGVELVLLAGVESAPFYRWDGLPLPGRLRMYHWHRHLAAFGLDDADVLEKLPVVSNPAATGGGFRVYALWPLLLLVPAGWCFVAVRRRRRLGVPARSLLVVAWLLVVFAVLGIVDGWPFEARLLDPYRPGEGERPYQRYIDYVVRNGGVCFWVHPLASNESTLGGVHFVTEPYPEMLALTRRYTGFSVFYDGYRGIGEPGGLWDALLGEYCKGTRSSPVWCIGYSAFDEGDAYVLRRRLRDLRTVLLVDDLTRRGVLDAFRAGRMYVVRGKASAFVFLEEFVLLAGEGAPVTMGQTARSPRPGVPVTLRLKLGVRGGDVAGKTVRLLVVRDGVVVRRVEGSLPFALAFSEPSPAAGMHYYRVEAVGPGFRLVSNPVFLEAAPTASGKGAVQR